MVVGIQVGVPHDGGVGSTLPVVGVARAVVVVAAAVVAVASKRTRS